MSIRGEGEQNPFLRRVRIVMKVQMGEMSVTDAARELGISRAYYYLLEEEMLRASLGAVTPQKPGPKPPAIDPKIVVLEEKLKESERDRELLKIKVKHLEDLQRDMVTRGIGVLREKKRPNHRSDPRRHRKEIHGRVQADGTLEGRGAPSSGRGGPGSLQGDGPPSSQPMAVEDKASRRDETGTQGTRG